MNYKKLFLIILFMLIILSPIFYVYHKYKIQQQIGQQECEKRGFIYIETLFKNKVETIFCEIEKTKDVIKLIKYEDRWVRTS